MCSVSSIAFPYYETAGTRISLNKLFLTDETDTTRYCIALSESSYRIEETEYSKKECTSISKIDTGTQEVLPDLLSYITNPQSSGPTSSTPLLVRIAPSYHRIKFNISVHPLELEESDRSLIILKTFGHSENMHSLRKYLVSGSYDDKAAEISKLHYSQLPLDPNSSELQRIIINDSFHREEFHNNKLNISLWEFTSSTNSYTPLFNFQLWIDEIAPQGKYESDALLSPTIHSLSPALPTSTSSGTQKLDESLINDTAKTPLGLDQNNQNDSRKPTFFTIAEFRKAFNFNIEDGPEFRKALQKYETDLPVFKKIVGNLLDELRGLELYSRKLSHIKNKIIDQIGQLSDIQFNSLVDKLHFKRQFARSLKSIFEPFELNLKFFLNEVCDNKLVSKISSLVTPTFGSGNKETSSDYSELIHSKKSFENNSKEYYNWLNKYLSNEKERPESKLLMKRKSFELYKFDYLNNLNVITNNQYFNQLLENFFKFINLPYDSTTHYKLLSFDKFRDVKLNQDLLSDDFLIYLNVLSRFNSEKFQFRQMIEACQSNEELTHVIRYSRLNQAISGTLSDSVAPAPIGTLLEGSDPMSPKEQPKRDADDLKMTDINTVIVTKSNLDLIFNHDSPLMHQSSVTAIPIQSRYRLDEDQNSEMAGILYTLGGQGKPGWHKEWVVLNTGRLIEYSDWRNGQLPINKPIDIALSSVKPTNHDKRQNCFEILTSAGNKHVFQAINEDERNKWVKALYNAGQLTSQLLSPSTPKNNEISSRTASGNSRSQHSAVITSSAGNTVHRPKAQSASKSPARIITDFGGAVTTAGGNSLTSAIVAPPTIPGQSLDRSVSPISISSNYPPMSASRESNYLALVRGNPDTKNHICVDCNSQEGVEWVSINFLACFCVKCSSCHRNLGSHISRIKSLKLDNFDNESEMLLRYINNKGVNSILESKLDTSGDRKINVDASNEERLSFIKRKYVTRKYRDSFDHVNDLLVKAIQKISILDILAYIVCGADVNMSIQISLNNSSTSLESRTSGSKDVKVFNKITLFEYSLRKFVEDTEGEIPKKIFLVSELLLLNGCKIDSLESLNLEIGLTDDAIEYWKRKRARL